MLFSFQGLVFPCCVETVQGITALFPLGEALVQNNDIQHAALAKDSYLVLPLMS